MFIQQKDRLVAVLTLVLLVFVGVSLVPWEQQAHRGGSPFGDRPTVASHSRYYAAESERAAQRADQLAQQRTTSAAASERARYAALAKVNLDKAIEEADQATKDAQANGDARSVAFYSSISNYYRGYREALWANNKLIDLSDLDGTLARLQQAVQAAQTRHDAIAARATQDQYDYYRIERAHEWQLAADAAKAQQQALSTRDGKAKVLINYARQYVGVVWYVWGGNDPSGFDCSGLIQWCYWNTLGIHTTRTTYTQIDAGAYVDPANIEPGDVLFYGTPPHHETLYVGNGMMIEAAHTGTRVREVPVRSFDAARRFF